MLRCNPPLLFLILYQPSSNAVLRYTVQMEDFPLHSTGETLSDFYCEAITGNLMCLTPQVVLTVIIHHDVSAQPDKDHCLHFWTMDHF